MNVNYELATMSNTAFSSAFLIYFVALILAVLYYSRTKQVIELERELAYQQELVAAGVGGSVVDAGVSEELPARGELESKLEAASLKAHKFGQMTQTMVWLGVIIHIASAVLRGVSTGRFPLGNLYEYILVSTAVAVSVAAIYLQRKEIRVLWPWMLVPVLALMFYGGKSLYAEAAPVVPALQSMWLPVHVSTVVTGASIGLVSGVASLLYIIRSYQPAGQEKGFWGAIAKPMPSAKVLDGIAYRTAIWTVPIFGLGIVLGAIWAESAWGRFWNWDPKETVSFVSWILYAAYLHARATFGWRAHGVAWINILAFATMVFNLFFINLVVSGLHSYAGLN